jgi:hypothetical protein
MKAHEVISTKDKWCKYNIALCRQGGGVYPCSEHAVRWCAVGAMQKAYTDLAVYNEMSQKLLDFISSKGFVSISVWNDNSTYSEVVKVLRAKDI